MLIFRVPIYIFGIPYHHRIMSCIWFPTVRIPLTCASFRRPVVCHYVACSSRARHHGFPLDFRPLPLLLGLGPNRDSENLDSVIWFSPEQKLLTKQNDHYRKKMPFRDLTWVIFVKKDTALVALTQFKTSWTFGRRKHAISWFLQGQKRGRGASSCQSYNAVWKWRREIITGALIGRLFWISSTCHAHTH